MSVLLIVLQIWAQHRSGVFILFESQDLQDSKTATHSKDELTLSILINWGSLVCGTTNCLFITGAARKFQNKHSVKY